MAAVIPLASDTPRAVDRWRFVALLAVVVGVVALYWPAAHSLGVLWLDSHRTTYSHGFVILAASGWLLWRARFEVAAPSAAWSRGESALLLAALLGASLLWLIAYRAGIQLAMEVLLLPLVWLAIATIL